MGIHSEIACAKRNVLEAEMCRRLWWALVLFDTRISEMADHRTATLAPTWDCKVPLNVNDSDLRPEMKESPAAQGSPTEALFAVVRSQLGEFTRNTAFHLDFSNPALKPLAKAGGDLDTLEKHFEDGYLKPLDPENPLHYITIWITRAYFAKSRLVEHFWRHATLSVHQTESQRDAAVSYALRTLECDTTIMTSPLTKGYYWFANNYFPFPAYIQILQDLRRRPMSKHAAQAWEVMSDNYEARFTFSTTRNDSIFLKLVSKVVLQAWEAREKASMQIGEPLMPPRMTSFIAQKVAQTAQQAQSPNTVATTGYMLQNTDGFPMSMPIPMGFGSDNLLSGMGGQDGYAGIGASPPDLDMDQMLWTAMGWDLPQQSSVPAAAPGPWNYG